MRTWIQVLRYAKKARPGKLQVKSMEEMFKLMELGDFEFEEIGLTSRRNFMENKLDREKSKTELKSMVEWVLQAAKMNFTQDKKLMPVLLAVCDKAGAMRDERKVVINAFSWPDQATKEVQIKECTQKMRELGCFAYVLVTEGYVTKIGKDTPEGGETMRKLASGEMSVKDVPGRIEAITVFGADRWLNHFFCVIEVKDGEIAKEGEIEYAQNGFQGAANTLEGIFDAGSVN